MNTILIIYHSNYGTTKQYVEWLAEELDADTMPLADVTPPVLRVYNTIILGCPIYFNSISCKKFIKKHFDLLKQKRFVLVTVGLTSPEETTILLQHTFPHSMLRRFKSFHLLGKINDTTLSPWHRCIIHFLNFNLKHKKSSHLTEKEKQFLNEQGKMIDYSTKEQILPILTYLKNSPDF